MALEFEHRDQEGIEVVALKGRLTFGEEDLALRNEIGKMLARGRIHVVLNLAGVTDIDTTGLGTLLYAMAELGRASGGLALARLHPSHMDLLVIAKMETVFKVFDNEQDAVNSFFPDRQVPRFDILEFLETLRRKSARV
jgi:anti-sigma B factor antagonist